MPKLIGSADLTQQAALVGIIQETHDPQRVPAVTASHIRTMANPPHLLTASVTVAVMPTRASTAAKGPAAIPYRMPQPTPAVTPTTKAPLRSRLSESAGLTAK